MFRVQFDKMIVRGRPCISLDHDSNKYRLEVFLQVLSHLISAVIACAADPEVQDLAEPFMDGICRHFAFLYAAGAGNCNKSKFVATEENPTDPQALKVLQPSIFLDALVQELSHDDKSRSESALRGMKIFVTTLIELCQAQRRLHTQKLAAAVDGEGASMTPQNSGESNRGTQKDHPMDGSNLPQTSLPPSGQARTAEGASTSKPLTNTEARSGSTEKPEEQREGAKADRSHARKGIVA